MRIFLFTLFIYFNLFILLAQDSNMNYKNFKIPLVEVKNINIADKKRYYARLEVNEGATYSVSVRTDGFLQNLFVNKTYENVNKDSPLFTFYSPELIDAQSEFLVTSAYNHSHLARQKLELLGVNKKEIEKLRKGGKIINEITFYSPINGVIFAKNFNAGSGVKKGDEIFKIINLDSIWVVANINQDDLSFLKEIQNINKDSKNVNMYAIINGNDKKIPLKLDKIYPNIVDNFIKVRFILDNKNGEFYPNMFANIYLESISKTRLVLPKSAILYKNKKYFVFVENDGEFMVQEIEAKRILGSDFYEIINGLELGEMVAKNALFMLDSDAQNNGDFE